MAVTYGFSIKEEITLIRRWSLRELRRERDFIEFVIDKKLTHTPISAWRRLELAIFNAEIARRIECSDTKL